MKLEQTIRRILREERNLSLRIRRRIPIELLEEKFIEAFNFALKLVKKLKRPSTAKREVVEVTINYLMDVFHNLFIETLPDNERWYDDIQNELKNHFEDRIIQMYDEIGGINYFNESVLKEDSNKKLLAYQKLFDTILSGIRHQCEELNSENDEIISFDACDFIESLTEMKVVDITRDGTVQVILKYDYFRYIDYDPFIYEFKHELKKYGNVKIDVIDSINTHNRQW